MRLPEFWIIPKFGIFIYYHEYPASPPPRFGLLTKRMQRSMLINL